LTRWYPTKGAVLGLCESNTTTWLRAKLHSAQTYWIQRQKPWSEAVRAVQWIRAYRLNVFWCPSSSPAAIWSQATAWSLHCTK
jgi:hypothetical protein